ncbi:putative rhomboid protein [Lachnellula arida]|uniref:Rhomboid-type serine protease n=1 Tax=Lachnellula arida TaxID=1316785 RepID=A0A8T9BDW5_9HELO|nr:putative rhomboid protein [Lachnellula arida]
MAANDYYNPSSHHEDLHTPQPQYQSYNYPPAPPSTSLPAYTSQPPSRPQTARPTEISPVSPFEAPFDDHVYPMGGTAQRYGNDSQSTLGADSKYYGQGGGGRMDSTNSFRDDIPLRDHTAAPAQDSSTDHVYDAGDPGAPRHLNNHYSNQYNQQYPPVEEGKANRKSGLNFLKKKGRIPFVVYTLTLVQVIVFIVEIVKNAQLTGSPIEIHPSFNPMIGPSPFVLINMGARYMPCMHNVHGVQDASEAFTWPCPNSTTNSGDCSLSQLCGFSGVPEPNYSSGSFNQKPEPDQWFRFIIPMFMHAGIIHIGFNMLLQMTLGREIEILIGSVRFFVVYIASGIFGFVLGGNFAASGIASTGASGALFGILAITLLDLLYHWSERPSPWVDLAFILLDVVISFVLGLLPGLDNFSHIGGFFMGLVLGICLLRSPASLQKRIGQDPPYTPVNQSKADGDRDNTGVVGFAKAPMGFFKGRKPAWWAWWLVRVAMLVFALIVFILLLKNFYTYKKTCGWCKYLSCLPIKNWCDVGNIQLTTSNTTSKRSVFDTWEAMAKLYEA